MFSLTGKQREIHLPLEQEAQASILLLRGSPKVAVADPFPLQMETVMGFFIYTHPPPFKDNFPFGKIEALERCCG